MLYITKDPLALGQLTVQCQQHNEVGLVEVHSELTRPDGCERRGFTHPVRFSELDPQLV